MISKIIRNTSIIFPVSQLPEIKLEKRRISPKGLYTHKVCDPHGIATYLRKRFVTRVRVCSLSQESGLLTYFAILSTFACDSIDT